MKKDPLHRYVTTPANQILNPPRKLHFSDVWLTGKKLGKWVLYGIGILFLFVIAYAFIWAMMAA